MWLFTLAAKSAWIGIMARIGCLCCSACQPSGSLRGAENQVMCNEELVSRKVTGVADKWVQSFEGWCWCWESKRGEGLASIGELSTRVDVENKGASNHGAWLWSDLLTEGRLESLSKTKHRDWETSRFRTPENEEGRRKILEWDIGKDPFTKL